MDYTRQPLVSIIIPCFNHGEYLGDAIGNVLSQTYKNVEVVVVDDGSVDNTSEVVCLYPQVNYIYQTNQGLSSARNTGITNSSGEYLVFLDADDLLSDHAIEFNLKFLLEHPQLAFVSGGYQVTTIDKKKLGEKREAVPCNHYLHLLRGNYIGMHGTVMYRRIVFNDFYFDESLKAWEDFDMYLKVARRYQVAHNTEILAYYRMHTSNMSGNSYLMLSAGVEVFNKHKQYLANIEEEKALEFGLRKIIRYYTADIFDQLRDGTCKDTKQALLTLKRYNLKLYLAYIALKGVNGVVMSSTLKKIMPEAGIRMLNKVGFAFLRRIAPI